MSETTPVDTTNKFFVGVKGGHITVMYPVSTLLRADALNLAAYLVTLVGDDDLWERTLAAVQGS